MILEPFMVNERPDVAEPTPREPRWLRGPGATPSGAGRGFLWHLTEARPRA